METRLIAVQAGASNSAGDIDTDIADLDPRDKKIVDLAKRNRAVNLSLSREKAKCHKLERDLELAQEELAQKRKERKKKHLCVRLRAKIAILMKKGAKWKPPSKRPRTATSRCDVVWTI